MNKLLTKERIEQVIGISKCKRHALEMLGIDEQYVTFNRLLKKFNIICTLPPRYRKTTQRITKICSVCKKEFIVLDNKWGNRQKTCSISCSNTEKKKGVTYKKVYKCYRQPCLTHNGKSCILCEFSDVVVVHHLDHNRKNNNLQNLVTLCPNHHALAHKKEFREQIEQQIKQKLPIFSTAVGSEAAIFNE